MEYIILFFSVLCIAAQFNINKLYQKKFSNGLRDMLFFPFVCGIGNVVFFTLISLISYGWKPEFSLFSFLMSIGVSLVSSTSLLVGLLVMKYGKMSVYSVFMMLGGMILPYFYGLIFLDETASPARIIGLVILICALPCSAVTPSKEKKAGASKLYYLFCAIIFVLNGTLYILSKTHAISTTAISPSNFIIYANLFSTAIYGAAYFIVAPRLIKSKKPEEPGEVKTNRFHAAMVTVLCAVVGGTGYFLQLITAETVPAVAMFPFITGGSIVLSTVVARIFFKEKIGKLSLAGIIMSMAGTLLFLV